MKNTKNAHRVIGTVRVSTCETYQTFCYQFSFEKDCTAANSLPFHARSTLGLFFGCNFPKIQFFLQVAARKRIAESKLVDVIFNVERKRHAENVSQAMVWASRIEHILNWNATPMFTQIDS